MSRGVKVLSLYVFSTENFKRAQEEVGHLMDLLVAIYKKELKTFAQNNLSKLLEFRLFIELSRQSLWNFVSVTMALRVIVVAVLT